MLAGAFLWAVQAMAAPACSMIISMMVSKYLQYKEKEGLATFVSTSSMILLLVLWLIPKLGSLANIAMGIGAGSSYLPVQMPVVEHFFPTHGTSALGSNHIFFTPNIDTHIMPPAHESIWSMAKNMIIK